MIPKIENNSSQSASEVQASGKKECPPSIYGVVMTILLDSFITQLKVAKMQSDAQKENAMSQEKVIENLSACQLKEIPKDAWEKVTEKVIDHYEKHLNPSTGGYDYDPVYRDETKMKLTKPELLDPVLLFNQEQMRKQQDYQSDLSVDKQLAQIALATSSATAQGASGSCTLFKKTLDVVETAVKKSNKMKG